MLCFLHSSASSSCSCSELQRRRSRVGCRLAFVQKLCKEEECTCGLCLHSAYHRSFQFRNVVYNELNFNRCNKLQFATFMPVCASVPLIQTCMHITHECVRAQEIVGGQQRTKCKIWTCTGITKWTNEKSAVQQTTQQSLSNEGNK